ncbi:MAG: CinA family protein [Chloroflexi bacterium]|nr:CinA family protein [Chloroflexota bacterium]
MTDSAIEYARQVGAALQQRQWTIATAESCTGGLLGHLLTEIAGSSAYYQGGVIAYSNEVKQSHLGVPAAILASEGAVSEATARAMAQGVRERIGTTVGVSTTGIAGPGGGTATKPVGLVYMCVATPETMLCRRYVFEGDRQQNKQYTALRALELILAALDQDI